MKSFLIAAVAAFLLAHLTDGLTFSPDYPPPPRTSYGLMYWWGDDTMDHIQRDLHLWWDEHQNENTNKVDGKALVDEMIEEMTKVLNLPNIIWASKQSLDHMVWGMKSKGIPHFLKQMERVMDLLERLARASSKPITTVPPMPSDYFWY